MLAGMTVSPLARLSGSFIEAITRVQTCQNLDVSGHSNGHISILGDATVRRFGLLIVLQVLCMLTLRCFNTSVHRCSLSWVDVILTRSNVRVYVMELLNFQKLAKTSMHAISDYCQPLPGLSSLRLNTVHVAHTTVWKQWRQSIFVTGVF